MRTLKRRGTVALFVLLTALAIIALAATGCKDDDKDKATPTPEPTAAVEEATDEADDTSAEPADGGDADDDHEPAEITLNAAAATITVDGDNSDWAGIDGANIPMEQIEIPAGVDWDEPGPLDPIQVVLKVATDSDNIYVLVEVPDDFDFNAEDHNLSAAVAVMYLIDQEAGPHMGAGDDDLELGLGMVDIWHWELDCGPGEMSGGGDPGSGDDPDCNLDDEYATDPEEREDDGGGDIANASAENSLAGVWEHTARAQGAGADGTWIFEMSRPLQTGDTQDAQFTSGDTAHVALAYFDADETLEGWTDTGHLQSSENGWIDVILP